MVGNDIFKKISMASLGTKSSQMASIFLLLGFLAATFDMTSAQTGVCYGMMGNNLPSHSQVVSLYRSRNIRRMRLYDPNQEALQALRRSNIEVILGVPNSELQYVASSRDNARAWVQRNVRNYWPDVRFRYIAVGNEVSPINGGTAGLAQFVHPALTNVHEAIAFHGLRDNIKVSTAIDTTFIGVSYPPSAGSFRGDIRAYFDPIIGFLNNVGSPLLANIYTYFSYSGNPRDISLPYALFTSPTVVVWDNGNGYQNLFDAMLDSLYSCLERAGGGSLEVVVSESGWPSDGGFGATYDNARAYYTNFVQHVGRGSPKRPGKAIEAYLFAMFDENNKNPEIEKHFGVFYPNQQPKFPLNFGAERISDIRSENNTMSASLVSDV